MKHLPPLDLDVDWLEQLDHFIAAFRSAFSRTEQLRWASVYVQGLLREGTRKNIESLARRVEIPADREVTDPAQALQNFINQSPWDEGALWTLLRQKLATRFAHPQGVLVVQDLNFSKRGQRSVGVQRQYSPAFGKKTNCQTAVSVHFVHRRVPLPLAIRLYLPQRWYKETDRLRSAGVPEALQEPARKWQIALELLDEVRADGFPGWAVTADVSYGSEPAFRDGLASRGLHFLTGAAADDPLLRALPSSTLSSAWDPYRGTPISPGLYQHAWHPLPFPADEPLVSRHDPRQLWLLSQPQDDGSTRLAFSNLTGVNRGRKALHLWHASQLVEQGCQRLRDRLGLDHFEGRSWRGFHHHVCLVALAYAFCLLKDPA